MSKSIEKNIASVNKGAEDFTSGLKQLAQTAAQLTGHTYGAAHDVSPAIPVVQK